VIGPARGEHRFTFPRRRQAAGRQGKAPPEMSMFRPRRITVRVLGAVLVAASLTACASDKTPPSVAFPSPTEAPVHEVTLPPVSSYSGYQPPLNAITTQISGIPDNTRMYYTMAPLEFTVTIKNSSTFTFQNLEPLVVLGQCTCNPAEADAAPYEFLEYWDAQVSAWRPTATNKVRPDLSFEYNHQIQPITLGAKASVSIKYRVYLGKAPKETGLVKGAGALDYYVLQLPGHNRVKVDTSPDASVPLIYAVG
jgi:hypothetical protein